MRERPELLEGPIGPTLVRLALPAVAGIGSIILFNVVDTYFVGQLSAQHLAAMSFTFPVTFVVMSLTMGVSIGTTSVLARALGHGDDSRVRRLATDAIILALVLVNVVGFAGLLSIDPLFEALGANPAALARIRQYMIPWYLGVGLLVVPMVGNAAIRATGDLVTPSAIMIVAGLVNIALDPIFIFGWGPVPRMELQGAAYATLASWVVTFAAGFWVLIRRERLLVFCLPQAREVLRSWKDILHVGAPAGFGNMLAPIGLGVITRLVAEHGEAAVAAYGAAQRVESLSLIGLLALTMALTTFVGQNYGAGRWDRLRAIATWCVRAAAVYGAVVALALGWQAEAIIALFNADPEVHRVGALFFRMVPWSFAFYGIAILVNSFFNAADRPLRSTALIALRLFGFAVPLAFIGGAHWGVTGIFGGVALGNLLTGLVAVYMVRRFVRGLSACSATTTAVKPVSEID